MKGVRKKPSRFLNESPEALERRRVRLAVRKSRLKQKRQNRLPRSALIGKKQKQKKKLADNMHQRKPCCGLYRCHCKSPKGLVPSALRRLAVAFRKSPMQSAADTTDVEGFMRLSNAEVDMIKVPLWVTFGLGLMHTLFNREALWKAFIRKGAVVYKHPWLPNFHKIEIVLRDFKRRSEPTRSGNYYSVTLRKYSWDSGRSWEHAPTDSSKRDALSAELLWSAIPVRLFELYEKSPSRDFWRACMEEFNERIGNSTSGICSDYTIKWGLDRTFSVKMIDPGTVSWWPVDCPAYRKAYKSLWKDLPEDQKFNALMTIYRRLKKIRKCSIPDALAHTCWLMKADANTLGF